MVHFSAALAVSMLSISCDLSVPARQPKVEIAENKPISEEVKKIAADYAETILEAIQILSKQHVKKASQAQLTDWAIRGLYERYRRACSCRHRPAFAGT